MAITGIDTIEGKQIIAAGAVSAKSAEMAYNDENGNPITGYQVAGDYYSASNPSGFITGVDLTPYQTVEGMTAYQEAGDYYSASNPSGFITAVPDTYLQNTDLSTADGKVTAISGIPLSAGGDVPEGVMVESDLEYNAVNEISAYNGSAIAQYGAEKQWLVHDDTLVHAANSAQYALGVNLSAVAQLLGVDETVLYSGFKAVGNAGNATYELNEEPTNFNTVKVLWALQADTTQSGDMSNKGIGSFEFQPNDIIKNYTYIHSVMNGNNSTTGFSLYDVDTNINNIKTTSWDVRSVLRGQINNGQWFHIYKVIGIGRKS